MTRDKLVSVLNNYLERHQKDVDFEDWYINDIVSEAGFGYDENDPKDTFSAIVGDDIVKSGYTVNEAAEMIKKGITNSLIELFASGERAVI